LNLKSNSGGAPRSRAGGACTAPPLTYHRFPVLNTRNHAVSDFLTNDWEGDALDVIEQIRPGIVAVLKPKGEPNGTSFFVTSDGYLLTCYHVVKPALVLPSIQVQSQEGIFDADLVEELSCSDNILDFAVLKVRADRSCLPLAREFDQGDPWCTLGFELVEQYHGVPNDGTIKQSTNAKVKAEQLNIYH
jgi:S1-C subfamily serine protease